MKAAGLAEDTSVQPTAQPNPPEATTAPAQPEPAASEPTAAPALTTGLPADATDPPSPKGVQVAEADTGIKTDEAPASTVPQPTSATNNGPGAPQIDLDKAVAKLNEQAQAASGGQCGVYVKAALKAGGRHGGERCGVSQGHGTSLAEGWI